MKEGPKKAIRKVILIREKSSSSISISSLSENEKEKSRRRQIKHKVGAYNKDFDSNMDSIIKRLENSRKHDENSIPATKSLPKKVCRGCYF